MLLLKLDGVCPKGYPNKGVKMDNTPVQYNWWFNKKYHAEILHQQWLKEKYIILIWITVIKQSRNVTVMVVENWSICNSDDGGRKGVFNSYASWLKKDIN